MAEFFISYSRADSAFADRLYTALVGRGYTAWMDREKLEGGQRFTPEISKQIRECQCVLVLLSPTSITSDWVEKEVQYAHNINKVIIPLDIASHDPYIMLINYQTIDFINTPFDQALDSVVQSYRTGNAAQRQPNTPPVQIDPQQLYQEGVEAQHKGDLETALAKWNQILAQEPHYLNGYLARLIASLEDQVRPQRISRIESRAQEAFSAQQWAELFSLLNGLYALDDRGTVDFAVKLLVDGANQCYRAGKWDDEIAFWDQVLRWQPDYPHAQERKEVATTNKALEPRYVAARNFTAQGNSDLARQELRALWKSAPYYGDPDNITGKLGQVDSYNGNEGVS